MLKRRFRRRNKPEYDGIDLIAYHEKSSINAEQYRALRTNIQFTQLNRQLKSLLVTSSIPSEGKSTVSANLAFVMAQTTKKILLIDADLRKPTVHKTFKLNNEQGLTSLLINPELNFDDLVQYNEEIKLYLLPSGPIPPNPSELLGSMQMDVLIEKLEQQFDLIIIDVPPVTAVTDGLILSSRVDGVLLVARYGYTRKEEVKKSKDTLEGVDAQILGYVMNRQPISNSANYPAYYEYGVIETLP